MRRSEATALTWADVGLRDNGSNLLQVHRSKTDPEGEGVEIYIGREAAEALQAIDQWSCCWTGTHPSSGSRPGRPAGE